MTQTVEKEYIIPGVMLLPTAAEAKKREVLKVLDMLNEISSAQAQMLFNNSRERGENQKINCRRALLALERCIELEKQFKVVIIDTEVTKVLRTADRKTINAPLIWRAKLPAPAFVQVIHEDCGARYKLVSKTPAPTPEAIKALVEHGERFDRTELWWVPKDILVTKIPDPDPILVGVIETHCGEPMYFELHRWVDSTIEDGWWSKEAY